MSADSDSRRVAEQNHGPCPRGFPSRSFVDAAATIVAIALGLTFAACRSDDSGASTGTVTAPLSDDSPTCQGQPAADRLQALKALKGGKQIPCTVSGDFQCPCGSFCNASGICQTDCAPTDL